MFSTKLVNCGAVEIRRNSVGYSERLEASPGFRIKEAKAAWRQRAWRTSVRWRGNFVIMGGVLLFATGLFSIFVVIGANGIRLLSGAAILYALVRTFIAFARA